MRILMSLLLLASLPASAFTPESGNWWNPNEPGRGFTIEIQDDFLFMTIYTYDNDGEPAWYTAQGRLIGNDRFVGEMIRFRNGQCLGCPFRPNQQVPGIAFPIQIDFLTEITARLIWPWGTLPIERLNFFLGDFRDEAMRGEWQTTIDLLTDPRDEYPFYGDVLIIDTLELIGGRRSYSGCRAEDSVSGRCTTWARNNQEAVGFRDQAEGNVHVIVVENSPTTFMTYFIRVGTYQFDGHARIYPRGQNPSGPLYPVRGQRTASWQFVRSCRQGNCVGPAGAPDPATSALGAARGLVIDWPSEGGLDIDGVAAELGADAGSLLAAEAALAAELGLRQQLRREAAPLQ